MVIGSKETMRCLTKIRLRRFLRNPPSTAGHSCEFPLWGYPHGVRSARHWRPDSLDRVHGDCRKDPGDFVFARFLVVLVGPAAINIMENSLKPRW